jgi:hypothetical protein
MVWDEGKTTLPMVRLSPETVLGFLSAVAGKDNGDVVMAKERRAGRIHALENRRFELPTTGGSAGTVIEDDIGHELWL